MQFDITLIRCKPTDHITSFALFLLSCWGYNSGNKKSISYLAMRNKTCFSWICSFSISESFFLTVFLS